jgi:hypothetical protein
MSPPDELLRVLGTMLDLAVIAGIVLASFALLTLTEHLAKRFFKS